MTKIERFLPSRPTSEFFNYQRYGAAIPPAVGSLSNPATSLSQIRDYYQYQIGTPPVSDLYYFYLNSTIFQTYCLFNEFGGNDWMLMFMANANSSNLSYSAAYWSTRSPLNASQSNLNYMSNRTINVATDVVNNYPFRYMALSSYGQNFNLSTYSVGSSTNSSSNLLTSYTSIGMTMAAKVGTGLLTEPMSAGSGGTAGSEFRYNQSASASSGTGYARWGQAQYAEPWAGSFFTFRSYGLGCSGSHACNSAYNWTLDFGIGSGRTSGGGCGDAPSGGGTFIKHEMWVR